jgi:hypothetical protein
MPCRGRAGRSRLVISACPDMETYRAQQCSAQPDMSPYRGMSFPYGECVTGHGGRRVTGSRVPP